MNIWRDFGDSMSYLHRADGEVLAEMISSRYDRWSIKVNHKARGLWIGRDLAKAACERIVEMERPGRIVVQHISPSAPSFWQRWFGC
jgi:ribosomal protein S18 acetylase RimI-like enzyme